MSKVIVALDYPSAEQAIALTEEVGQQAIYKVGMELFNAVGPSMVHQLTDKGYKIFLDLKFHDIPNTVAGAARSAVRTGCFMFNVHALGGSKMIKAAVDAARQEAVKINKPCPKIIAVTILTSMGEDDLQSDLNVTTPLKDYVVHLAILAKLAGADGVVASPQEIEAIRNACGKDFLIVTPGVRPVWAEVNDQKRIMTPQEAVKKGADYVVVGRPITSHQKPQYAFQQILAETEEL